MLDFMQFRRVQRDINRPATARTIGEVTFGARVTILLIVDLFDTCGGG